MKTKDLSDALLRELDGALTPRGFVRRSRDQNWRREQESCQFVFHVSFIRHTEDVDVTAEIAIRYHAIEELLNAKRTDLSSRERRETATIGVELGNLVGTGQHRWNLATLDDVLVAARDILEWFERLGTPWFERFHSIHEVRRVLSERGGEALLICPFREEWPKILDAIAAVTTH